jgi:hypothetical protein
MHCVAADAGGHDLRTFKGRLWQLSLCCADVQGAANAINVDQLGGPPLAQALGATSGSSQGRTGASKWLRPDYASPAAPVQAEVSNVINVG